MRSSTKKKENKACGPLNLCYTTLMISYYQQQDTLRERIERTRKEGYTVSAPKISQQLKGIERTKAALKKSIADWKKK